MFVGENGTQRTADDEQREGEEHEFFGNREIQESLAVDGPQHYSEEDGDENELRRDIDHFASKTQRVLEIANLAKDKD